MQDTTTTVAKSVQPLQRPPEEMRPDRPEIMTAAGAGRIAEIEPGVQFECLVGASNQARNLTTGLVTFRPGARLQWHTHPFTESITLLRGQATVGVEGRDYELELFDNVVIPRDIAHSALNTSGDEPTILHVAMGTHTPTRMLINRGFAHISMPRSATGYMGAERVNRFHLAERCPAGPNTEFIDFFNRALVPGIEMSGGYGLFHPGGRLPAHLHDFDESISIVSGEATCIVEGRRHVLSDCATALVPRGRIHFFRNESSTSMSMLWVYAGPMPERIVVDEQCATANGNPWR